ncbi:MAG: hypothetical protein COY80_04970 [Candidatus Pacebacteria bacterium CG_4_10_14_0_8_um_filter_42_14]|nr:MAG: hypothetical protein COY80_04970 [Candidatus Pacebacteria bacterium CG_4_10_14_0_8_um_filter_42_14]
MLHQLRKLFFTLCLFLSVSSIRAAETPFSTALHTTYTVSKSGITKVEREFKITNLTATQYITEYSLKSHLSTIENLTAKSNNKDVPTNILDDGLSRNITLKFEDEVVGEGKTRTFLLTYETEDLTSVVGQVLELHIPKLADSEAYTQRSVTIKTPLNYGKATRINPEPETTSYSDSQVITSFPDLGGSGVTALFGSTQIFTSTLRYHLENSSSSIGVAQIALPPDTPHQKMYYQVLEPASNQIKVDPDGNWIATYELQPNTALTIYLTMDTLLSLEELSDVPQPAVLDAHTKNQKYWETGNSTILDIVKDKNTVEELYQYVVTTLSYSADLSSIPPRKGAVEALSSPAESVCQEFTDLFVTLARAKGVPARRLTGFAYSEDSELRPLSLQADVLHAWPEYFDQEQRRWHSVDPTWENTTGGVDYFNNFDLNHIVFAINGESSTTPYAAGSYKPEDFETKDVEVSAGNSFPALIPNLSVELIPQRLFNINVPGSYLLRIINSTGAAWYSLKTEITAEENVTILNQGATNVPVILPYQSLDIPIFFINNKLELPQEHTALINLISPNHEGKTNTSFNVKSGPKGIQFLDETNVAVGLVAGFTLVTLIAGSLLVFRRRR